MDKCIKVLIPTGEIRLELDENNHYQPSDKESEVAIEEFCDRAFWIQGSAQFDGWVVYEDMDSLMLFKVIDQYGDEFPV